MLNWLHKLFVVPSPVALPPQDEMLVVVADDPFTEEGWTDELAIAWDSALNSPPGRQLIRKCNREILEGALSVQPLSERDHGRRQGFAMCLAKIQNAAIPIQEEEYEDE